MDYLEGQLFAIQIMLIAVSLAGASMIVLYSTWLLIHRLRNGEPKARSFREWMKGLAEAVIGL
ncbi:MAG: hypothetical protein ACREVL_10170 [Solimonas sp.]